MVFFFTNQINWDQPALILHNFIRGNDKVSHYNNNNNT